MSIWRNTIQPVLATTGVDLPGSRDHDHPATAKQGDFNPWVRDHLIKVLDLSPERLANEGGVVSDWEIGHRLEPLGGTGKPFTIALFTAPAKTGMHGEGFANFIDVNKARLTHARSGLVGEDGLVNRELLDRVRTYIREHGKIDDKGVRYIPTSEVGRVLNTLTFEQGKIDEIGKLGRVTSRIVIQPVEWALLAAAVGGQVREEDLVGLYDHTLFDTLRLKREAVAFLDNFRRLWPGHHDWDNQTLNGKASRLIAFARAEGFDGTSVEMAETAARKVLENESSVRTKAYGSKQGYPLGSVGLASFKLLCPVGKAALPAADSKRYEDPNFLPGLADSTNV